MKTCTACKLSKSDEEFNFKIKSKGIRVSKCKPCIRKYQRSKYNYDRHTKEYRDRQKKLVIARSKVKLLEYLSDKCCIDCKENDPIVLDFDHIRDKKYNISTMLLQAFGWNSILKEIDKCEIRCANCHRRKTARAGNQWRHRAIVAVATG